MRQVHHGTTTVSGHCEEYNLMEYVVLLLSPNNRYAYYIYF